MTRVKKPESPLAVLTATYLAIVLIIVLPGWILLAQTPGAREAEVPYEASWALQAFVVIWAGIRLTIVYAQGRIRFMAVGFWIYVYVFLGLAPLSQMFTGKVPGPGLWSADAQLTATFIVLVGLLAYEVGTKIADRPRKNAVEFTSAPVRSFNMHRVWLLALVGLGFAAFYAVLLGPATLFQLRSERSEQAQATFDGSPIGLVVGALATVPTVIALLGFIDAKKRGEKGLLVIIPILLAVVLIFANPVSSTRFWSGVVLGALTVVVFNLGSTARRFRGFVAGALVVFIFAFPYADLFRNERTAGGTDASLAALMSDKLDYDSFAQITLTVEYVERLGHTYGTQLLGALTAAVPRDWWPEKPLDTGIVLADFAGYWFKSISAPLWAEAWIDGGWLWLFVVFGALGLISRRLDNRYAEALANPTRGIWLSVVPLFSLYQIMTLRGSFLQQAPQLVLFIVLFWWVSAKGSSSSEPAPDLSAQRKRQSARLGAA